MYTYVYPQSRDIVLILRVIEFTGDFLFFISWAVETIYSVFLVIRDVQKTIFYFTKTKDKLSNHKL